MEKVKVQLRDIEDRDLAIFFQQQLDPAANQMAAFTRKDPADKAGFMEHWDRLRRNKTVRIKTVLLGDTVAGSIAKFEQEGEAEITYWIGKEYWGKGVATRALSEFLIQLQERPIFARVACDNLASKRVLEKCGFTVVEKEKGFANARGQEIEEFILKLEKAP